jgi:glycosyltransferase involved in cell wall biosynthesis
MSRTKRSVVMVCSQMPPVYGGAGAQAALLGRELAVKGWEVTAITLDQHGVGSGTDRGVRFRRILNGVSPTTLWTRLYTTVGLSMASLFFILIKRPAVVHIHGVYWWSLLPAICGRFVRARVVVKTTRDGEDDAKSVRSKRLGNLNVGRIYGLPLKLADAVIVLNHQAREVAVSEGLDRKTRLIFNGVDEAKFVRTPERRARARAARGLSNDDRVVVFVGYLVKHKGVFDLLNAWRKLGNREARLWLVGPDSGFYHNREQGRESEISSLINSLMGDGYQVEKFGHLPGEEMPDLYWAADAFVLPSYAEGMPNSLAEALVAGCDIVATRIPGSMDIMGLANPDLFSPGDLDALVDQLSRAIKQPRTEIAELVDKVRISKVAATYDGLYAELLAKADG